MRASLPLALALLLAGCVTPSAPRTSPWLAGLWLVMDEGVEYPLACASGSTIRYTANGRYAIVEEEGTWRLEGDRLTEVATEVTGAGDANATDIGRPYVSRIAREGADSFLKTYENGEQARFRRCPDA